MTSPTKSIDLGPAWELEAWLNDTITGIAFKPSEREHVAATLFDQVVDHLAVVLEALDRQRVGSAYVLLRSMFETSVRGYWVLWIATENDLERFSRDKVN